MEKQVERRAEAGMPWQARLLPARLRRITSMEVAVTGMVAAFLSVFYGLNLLNDFENAYREWTAVFRFVGSLFIVALVIVRLNKFPMWVAFLGAVNEVSAFVYFVGFSMVHEQIVFRLQEFPLIALYLAWLFRSFVSRIIIYPAMLFTLVYSTQFGPAVDTPHENGLLNVLSLAFFTVVGLFVGSFARRHFKQQTEIDHLTGAINRRGLGLRGDALLAAGKKHGTPVSVVLIDMDKFKQINDLQGHGAGDQALIDLVQHLKSNTRKKDIVSRLGGDEFVLVLPDTAFGEAKMLVERLHASSILNWSYGVAETTSEDNLSMVILRADRAMYEFKRANSKTGD